MWRTKTAIPSYHNLSVALIHTWFYLYLSFIFFLFNFITRGGGWIWSIPSFFSLLRFEWYSTRVTESERERETNKGMLGTTNLFCCRLKEAKEEQLCLCVFVCVFFSWTVLYLNCLSDVFVYPSHNSHIHYLNFIYYFSIKMVCHYFCFSLVCSLCFFPAVAVVLFTTFIFIPAAKSTSTTRRTNSLDLEQKIKTRESIKNICTQFPRFICLILEVFKSTHRLSLA